MIPAPPWGDCGGASSIIWSSICAGSVGDIVGLTAISVFCAMAASLVTDKRLPEYINMAACCAAGVLICGSFGGFVTQTADAITRLSDYSRAAMPAVFTAAAACGAVTSSTAKYAAACLAMDVMISAANKFIIPLIYAFLAVNFSCALFENPMLRALSKLIKWLTTTMMTGLTLAFTAYISFTAVVSGSADAVAVKTAKTVISSTLPVVGRIMSDAASTVLAAAAMIRNSAGVFSLIAVGAMCIGPFALLSVKMTLFKAAGAVADMMPNSRLSSMLRDTGTAVAMLLGLLGCLRGDALCVVYGGNKGGVAMSAAIRELCLLAVLCAAVTSICPEGNVKKICSLTCSIVMITAALKPLAGFDFNEYAVQLAHYREMGAALTESSQELDNRLNRLVIEEECSAYIWDKAREYGVELTEVRVTAAWSTDGFWYPEGAVISCPDPAAASQALSGVIERELGILESAQEWRDGG